MDDEIRCPRCAKRIASWSAFCRRCGCGIDAGRRSAMPATARGAPPRSAGKGVVMLLGMFVASLFFVMAVAAPRSARVIRHGGPSASHGYSTPAGSHGYSDGFHHAAHDPTARQTDHRATLVPSHR